MRLNWKFYGEHAPLFVAKEKGYFEAQGLEVELLEGKGSGATIREVAGHPEEFGWADTASMIKLAATGLPVKTAGIFVQLSPMSFIYKSDLDIRSIQDLVGKRIARSPGTAAHTILPAIMAANNLQQDSFHYVTMPTSAGKLDALLGGQADVMLGFFIVQPIALKHEKNIQLRWKPYHEFGVNTLSGGVIVHNRTLEENPELVRSVVAAVQQGFREAQKDPAQAAKSMADATDPKNEAMYREQLDLVLEMLHTPDSKGKPPGWVAKEDWKQTVELLTTYGKMQGNPESHNYYTNQFLDGME